MSDTSGGNLPPAGWYADPENAGQQRYWDGSRWTEERRPDTAVPPPPGASSPSGGDTGTSWPTSSGSGGTGAGGYAGGGFSSPGYGAAGAGAVGTKPDPWLWQSIVATLLCCLPLGIAGIVFAAQSQSAWSSGDAATAAKKAQQAKTWTLASVGFGVIGLLLAIVTGVFSAGF